MGNIFNTLELYFKAAMMGGRWTKINNIQQIKHMYGSPFTTSQKYNLNSF